jgi:hypothetical protein
MPCGSQPMLRYLENETTRWKKEASALRQQLSDLQLSTARATRAWQEDWATELQKHHFDAVAHSAAVRRRCPCAGPLCAISREADLVTRLFVHSPAADTAPANQ